MVVNYESGPLLLACVASLLADTSAGAGGRRRRQRLADGSVGDRRGAARGAVVLTSGANLGYAAAANRGSAATHGAGGRGLQPRPRGATPARAAAMLARFDAEPDLAAVGPRRAQPRRLAVPVGPRDAVVARRVGPRAARTGSAAEPVHPSVPSARRRLEPRPRRRLGVGARCCACGGPRSTRSADGTSGTSCTWRTSICAGGSAGSAGGSRTSRAAETVHVQGASTARHPYRMIVRAPPIGVPVRGTTLARARAPVARPVGRVARRPRAGSRWRRGRCGRVPSRRGSAGNLRLAMPQSRTRSNRSRCAPSTASPSGAAADRSAGTSRSRSVVIIGVVAVVLTRGGGDSDAGSGPPRAAEPGDRRGRRPLAQLPRRQHLRRVAPNRRPRSKQPSTAPTGSRNAGIHSHADGLIHTHPFVVAEEGNNATVGKFFDYGGWGSRPIPSTSADSIARAVDRARPRSLSRPSGATATTARSASTRARRVELTWAVDGKPKTGNPGRLPPAGRRDDRDRLPARRARTLEFPPAACSSFANISDDRHRAVLSKNFALPHDQSTTSPTAPAATTTTATGDVREGGRPRGRGGHAPAPAHVLHAEAAAARSPTSRSSSASSRGWRHHGVDEVVLSLGYLPDAFEAHFPEARFGDRRSSATRSRTTRSAPPARSASPPEGSSERVVVCNGDVLTTLDLDALVAFHDGSWRRGHDLPHAGRRPVGVRCRADPTPTARSSPSSRSRRRAIAPTNWINAGTYVLEPSVLERIPPRLTVSIERETFPRMLEEPQHLYAMQSDAYWIDIGDARAVPAARTPTCCRGGSAPVPAPDATRAARRACGCRATRHRPDGDGRAAALIWRRRGRRRGRARRTRRRWAPVRAVGPDARLLRSVLHAEARDRATTPKPSTPWSARAPSSVRRSVDHTIVGAGSLVGAGARARRRACAGPSPTRPTRRAEPCG